LLRLDYISCLLTVVSTILVGRHYWHGWALAAVNSVIICVIALRTSQTGFIPANLFCLALYAHNIAQWRRKEKPFAFVAPLHSLRGTRKPNSGNSCQ
jgi:hypothetical protein